jgi:hypothetical protein
LTSKAMNHSYPGSTAPDYRHHVESAIYAGAFSIERNLIDYG